MNKKELIAALEEFKDSDVVCFEYPSGNHWRNIIVNPITEVSAIVAEYSEYNERLILVTETDDDTLPSGRKQFHLVSLR